MEAIKSRRLAQQARRLIELERENEKRKIELEEQEMRKKKRAAAKVKVVPKPKKRPPKMPNYRKISKNVYRKGIERRLDAPDSVPLCSCSPETGCDENCENRTLLMECAPGHCPTLKDGQNFCQNMTIQQCAFPATEVFHTPSRGWALRVTEDVAPGTMIVEYLGEVITDEEGMSRMMSYAQHDDLYFMSLDRGLMLDAKPMGSVARFANHSCEPNSELQKWSVLGEPRLVLVAIKMLEAGSEILYNYQYFEDGLEGMARQKCLCGVPTCSGIVGGRPEVDRVAEWCTRATVLMERTAPVCSCEQLVQHLDAAEKAAATKSEMAVLIASPEWVALQARVNEGDAWDEKAKPLLYDHSRCVSHEEVGALLSVAPSTVRPTLQPILQSRLKRAQRVQKEVEFYRPHLLRHLPSAPSTGPKSTDSAALNGANESSTHVLPSAQGEGDGEGESKLAWHDLLTYLREVSAVSPLDCGSVVPLLLRAWEACSTWALQHMARHCAAVSAWNHRHHGTSSNLWTAVSGLGVTYNVAVSPMVLAVFDILEERIEAYLLRQKHRILPVNDRKFTDVSVCMPRFPGDHAVRRKPDDEEDNCAHKLHCFCYLPEEESEAGLGVMMCCDLCARWYHPECINANPTTLAKDTKKGGFWCPLCQHARNVVTEYVRPPHLEWVLPRAPPVRRPSAISQPTLIELAQRRSTEAAAAAAAAPTGQPHPSDAPRFAPVLPSSFSRSGFCGRDLDEAVRSATRVPVLNVPAIRLLSLVDGYRTEWEERAFAALKRCTQHLDAASKRMGVWPNDPGLEAQHCAQFSTALGASPSKAELQLLQSLLWIYLETRVLFVCPPLVRQVRTFIWRLQAWACVRSLSVFLVPLAASTPPPHRVEMINRLSLSTLTETVAGGHACSATDTPEFRTVSFALRIAQTTLQRAGQWMSHSDTTMNTTEGVTTLVELRRKLLCIRQAVDIDSSYSAVTAMACLPASVGETRPELCWCNGMQGGDLLGCEGCDGWFHFACVLGVSADRKKVAAAKGDEAFLCMACTRKRGQKYVYAWPCRYMPVVAVSQTTTHAASNGTSAGPHPHPTSA